MGNDGVVPTFTLEQVKAAYWAEFHESGESWFDYLSGAESNANSTEGNWVDFEEKLMETISKGKEADGK